MTMPPKQNNQTRILDGKSTEHRNMLLTLGKTVLPHQGRGNIAGSTSSSTSPSLIGSTSTRSSNVTPTSSMLSSVSKMPPSSKKLSHTLYTPPTNDSKSSMTNDVKKKLKFSPKANISAKKQAFLINFCDRNEVNIECLKYLKHAVDLPINQESQLTFLLNQFQVRDIQASFYKLIGKVGRVASSTFTTPMSSQKKKLIIEFLRLIYDQKSMLIDTVEQSYR